MRIPHEYKFIEIAFGWEPSQMRLHTTLEGPWPPYMFLEVSMGQLLLDSHQFHGHGSCLVCEVALRRLNLGDPMGFGFKLPLNPKIICSPKFCSWFDSGISFEDPKLVHSRTFEMSLEAPPFINKHKNSIQCPGTFLGIIGWDPCVSKTTRLHMDIFYFSLFNCGIFCKFFSTDWSWSPAFEPVISQTQLLHLQLAVTSPRLRPL